MKRKKNLYRVYKQVSAFYGCKLLVAVDWVEAVRRGEQGTLRLDIARALKGRHNG